MTTFQPYAGAFTDDGETYRWNCYATSPVYEVRSYAHSLPDAPEGRKWVRKPQNAGGGPELVVLVDGATTDFSQMLTQITAAPVAALAF
ncbi:hypothetical protein LJR225_000782 [Phenylobacterium sp. LjRoot225]|uniref:hypothetical protein n=1 Tax=Phenylobacterium sp. LjRoot225 TaxID=3342285 RepID=UPI003ECF2317